MNIRIGSTNKAKVQAVQELLKEYPHLQHAECEGVPVQSEVNDQPLSLEETIRGAKNRAKNSFVNCTYAIGLESGLMEVPYTKSGYMDICACAIFDGKNFHLGLSSAWEFPDSEITRQIITGGMNMTQVIQKFGLSNNPNIGSEEGAVGILTKGRMTRKAYTQQALRTALIHLDP